MLIFLDFDGVLNSNMFFEKRHRTTEDGEVYRDHSESLLPFLDTEWFDTQHDSLKMKIESFYKNICYTNYKNLLKLLDSIDSPEIVLSTSWRNGFNLESWNALFNKLPGWKYPIIGKTPSNPYAGNTVKIQTGVVKEITISEITKSNWSRHEEILQFIFWYSEKNKRFPKNYIILDDDDIFEGIKIFRESSKHFFRTRRWSGLTNKDIRKIKKYIGGQHGM